MPDLLFDRSSRHLGPKVNLGVNRSSYWVILFYFIFSAQSKRETINSYQRKLQHIICVNGWNQSCLAVKMVDTSYQLAWHLRWGGVISIPSISKIQEFPLKPMIIIPTRIIIIIVGWEHRRTHRWITVMISARRFLSYSLLYNCLISISQNIQSLFFSKGILMSSKAWKTENEQRREAGMGVPVWEPVCMVSGDQLHFQVELQMRPNEISALLRFVSWKNEQSTVSTHAHT